MTITTIPTAAASRMRSLSATGASPFAMSVDSAWRVQDSTCVVFTTSVPTVLDAPIHATRLDAAPAANGRGAYVGSKQGRPPRGEPR